MLKIWGRRNSINVQKVLWCCGELGLAFERVDAGLQFGVNNTPEYRAMNPNGLVPTIDDDGFILWESHAIVRYLARKHGVGKLWPADARSAADADRWMEWYSTTLWLNVRPIFHTLVRTPPEKRNMQLVEDHRKLLAANWEIVEAQLAGRDYLAATDFTVADIPLGVAAYRWFNLPLERPASPNVERWYRRLAERSAFKEHCMLPLT
ncbi:MAG TPA: glutathione S-transferase N-terminal domain-containing protein [Burkholderiales bacterium]|nr:glutathione S-transferase N-terminal domain-containing protein [Burkholderiales bacterium]